VHGDAVTNACPITYRDFLRSVNMTPSEIRAWYRNPRAGLASFKPTRKRLPQLATLKAKPAPKWSTTDCAYARRVVNFNRRFEGMRRVHGCTVKIDVALRNWGRRACRPK
jgi:hypothetical protein